MISFFICFIFDKSDSIFCERNDSSTTRVRCAFRRAIFGAGMGRDDGHYCDVLSSGVNVFLVEGS